MRIMSFLRKRTSFLFLLFCFSCATPNIGPAPTKGATGKSTGGDADSAAVGVDFTSAFAQPGSTAVASPVRNEDRTSNSQAGDSIQLVLSGNEAAAKILNEQDPLEKLILKQIDAAMKAGDDARVDELRGELVKAMEAKILRARTVAPNYAQLKQIIFLAVLAKSNGEETQKLSAEAINAAATNLAEAMSPANEALK